MTISAALESQTLTFRRSFLFLVIPSPRSSACKNPRCFLIQKNRQHRLALLRSAMPIVSNSGDTAAPSFHEFKKQASFYLREKIKTARLALTDVTPAELLTEEAINGNPETRVLGAISRAAFEVDDYMRIVAILHQRFIKFEKKYWRVSYNSLIVLERLLTHGPESVANEFQSDKDVIREMESFQYIDEKGFNWGLAVRKKSERILSLLERESLLKEERDKARKLSRGIQGFGSFSDRTSSAHGESPSTEAYGRSHSLFNSQENDEERENAGKSNPGQQNLIAFKEDETRKDLKENIVPAAEEDSHKWAAIEESSQLLGAKRGDYRKEIVAEEDHPFAESEHQTTVSLIL